MVSLNTSEILPPGDAVMSVFCSAWWTRPVSLEIVSTMMPD